ncbi:MAG: NifU family protein [Actinomycetota bacterium]
MTVTDDPGVATQTAPPNVPPIAPPATFEGRARRIEDADSAVERIESSDDRATARELADAVAGLHESVLRTIVVRLRDDERGRELLYELVDDPEVYAALAKAGIVKPSLAMRAIQVLDGVRPYLTSHNGDVELVSIDDGVAVVRLLGACQGCGSSTETLRDSVARALLDHLPELTEVREAPPVSAPTVTIIPVSSIGFGRPRDRS